MKKILTVYSKKKIQKKPKIILVRRFLLSAFLVAVNIEILPKSTVKSKFQTNFQSRIQKPDYTLLGFMSQY